MTKNNNLRTGYSTGAAAAAAAKAAVTAFFLQQYPTRVVIHNLEGQPIEIPIHSLSATANGYSAVVVKDGGDDPDVTHGLEIVATITPTTDPGVIIEGGPGVGRVTKPGLSIPVGEYAINPVPRSMIKLAVQNIIPPHLGCIISIAVPDGNKVAHRTMNPRLGIVGGISILGTTGIVHPMSEDAYKESLIPQINMAVAHGYTTLVLTPGRMGVKWAREQGLPTPSIIETSNFIGFMLDHCVQRGVKKVLLWGHHGKLIKIAAGIFHTHSKVADARQETFAALAALLGANQNVIQALMDCITTEAMVEILKQQNLMTVLELAARRASRRAAAYVSQDLIIGTAMLSMDGAVVAADPQALMIGRELGWLM